jgi:CRP-like cAMP-binding protein
MLDKFARRCPLGLSDREALLALPYRLHAFEPGKYIIREGSSASTSALIIQGFAIRHKVTVDGERQILSFHVPGDFIDLEGALLNTADHNVQALSRCEMALVPVGAIRDMMDKHPMIARAMWVDTLVDSSIFREWVVNVGRRDARTRLAHLLCEFAKRLEVAGLSHTDGYQLPMTQEQLADATGLTSVHVNRTLKTLEKEGLVTRNKRYVGIPNWERLKDVAGFNELYLHLDQVAA